MKRSTNTLRVSTMGAMIALCATALCQSLQGSYTLDAKGKTTLVALTPITRLDVTRSIHPSLVAYAGVEVDGTMNLAGGVAVLFPIGGFQNGKFSVGPAIEYRDRVFRFDRPTLLVTYRIDVR